jgi:hypothetical protein
MPQEFIFLEAEIVKHFLEHATLATVGVRLKRDERSSAMLGDGFVIFRARISLVSRDLLDGEILGGLIDQHWKQGGVTGIALVNLDSGDDVGFHTAANVSLSRQRAKGTDSEDKYVPQRVTLDAMIRREDFGIQGEEFVLDLFSGFPIANLAKDAPILKLLRKPDFQRETNHWSSDQVATFVASFLDNEVIPSLILWKSPSYVFVIDGGHRLSALRAWMEDDYGDRSISQLFYNGEISDEQKRIANRTRTAIEKRIGRFSTLRDLVGNPAASEEQKRRSNLLFTRAISVQWIQGSASVAETSFFKINSQGTPLDETETMLIKNRRRPIAIGARAILRSGAGHRYWSAFTKDNQQAIISLAAEYFKIVFKPEIDRPLKTIDVPVGGSVSPVDALSLLIEFLVISGSRDPKGKLIDDYAEDNTGDETIQVLKNSLEIVSRITGNSPGSLGLHPAVYFYNERGKYSRFLFLGMAMLLTERIRNNDSGFFKKFTAVRSKLESFLRAHKSLIGIILQNMGKAQRVPKMRDLLTFVIAESTAGRTVSPEAAIEHLGLRGRIYDITGVQTKPKFSDETKSMIFVRKALESALVCPICEGILDPNKSVSYDHVKPVRSGGIGEAENGDLVHPYCNTGIKN